MREQGTTIAPLKPLKPPNPTKLSNAHLMHEEAPAESPVLVDLMRELNGRLERDLDNVVSSMG